MGIAAEIAVVHEGVPVHLGYVRRQVIYYGKAVPVKVKAAQVPVEPEKDIPRGRCIGNVGGLVDVCIEILVKAA